MTRMISTVEAHAYVPDFKNLYENSLKDGEKVCHHLSTLLLKDSGILNIWQNASVSVILVTCCVPLPGCLDSLAWTRNKRVIGPGCKKIHTFI